MDTTITIDNSLIEYARTISGLTTQRAIMEEALQLLIKHYQQRQIRQLRGKLRWEGDIDQMREERFDNTR